MDPIRTNASTLGSFDTLYSFTANCSNVSRDTNSEHLCRICHCSSMPDDPLISPCRCSGTLKFVHMTGHQFVNSAFINIADVVSFLALIGSWHDVHLPTIARRDLKYLTTFIVAVTLMFLSAIMSFACFYIERKFG
uniref:RING-CH-type domain-containing protein n=1 Tax=Parascaris equorum TaxID=6256 RepID=A0A914RGH0_PAREQ